MRVLAIVAALAALTARRAEACSPPMCVQGAFLPLSGTVPMNTPAFLWVPARSFSDPADQAVPSLKAGEAEVAIAREDASSGQTLLRTAAPLVAGTTYRFEAHGGCGPDALTAATFTAGPHAELPRELGALVVETTTKGPLTVADTSGSCSSQITAAQAGIRVELAESAKPWAELLTYRTFVDEREWRPGHGIGSGGAFGGSWEGRAKDRVFRRCFDGTFPNDGADPGLSSGIHRVRMEATLPGTSVALTTGTWLVDLACNGTAQAPHPVDVPLGGNPDEHQTPPTAPEGGCASAGAGALGLVALLTRRRT